MDPTSLLTELAAMPLFAGLDERQLEEVAGSVITRRVKPGKTVIKEGHWGHEFLLVLEGDLEVRRDGQVVATIGAGSFVGEAAVLGDVRRNATVVARTTVTVGAVPASLFDALLVDIPVLAERIRAAAARNSPPAAPA